MFIRLNLLLFNLGHCVLALAGQLNWINLLTAHIRISFYLPFLFGHIPSQGSSSGRWYDQKALPALPPVIYCLPPQSGSKEKQRSRNRLLRTMAAISKQIDRWTPYRPKNMIFHAIMTSFLSRICRLQRWTPKS